MKKLSLWPVIAVIIPLLALAGLVVEKERRMTQGEEVVLPIVGFDPRDLLSGHYLIYQIQYNVKNLCKKISKQSENKIGYVVINPPEFQTWEPTIGQVFIKGECKNGNFKAGIERFYIPQEHAKILDEVIRGKQGKIVLSVFYDGRAQVKDLLINDKSWSIFLEEQKNEMLE
ncbi:MAG: GDYXXLXY domain-containing protein [Magnetococcales bacterium]|nr:GDYXXLXY domain-containing protein [Magnetococcales bacterium]